MWGLAFLKPKIGMDLGKRELDGIIDGWALVLNPESDSPILNHRVRDIKGAVTEPIVGVDRRKNRILTLDYSVYELGDPYPEWASINESVLRYISWAKHKRQRT